MSARSVTCWLALARTPMTGRTTARVSRVGRPRTRAGKQRRVRSWNLVVFSQTARVL